MRARRTVPCSPPPRTHSRRDKRTGSRIRANDQLPGRSEECVRNKRQDARVQSDLGAEPGELRVGNPNRQGDSRDGKTRDNVARQIGTIVGKQIGQARCNSGEALCPRSRSTDAGGSHRCRPASV